MAENCMIAAINWLWEDKVTAFAGGSWVATDTVSRENLRNARTTSYARTMSAALADTILQMRFGAARRIDHVWLGFHNGTRTGRVRVLASGRPLDIDLTGIGAGVIPDGFTFACASERSYYDASGVLRWAGVDEPRYTHNPVTGAALGYFDETYADCKPVNSEDISAWTDDGATVSANAVVAPDGATTADRIVEKATTAVHGRTRAVTWNAGSIYRISWHAKNDTRSWQCLRIYDGVATKWAFFNSSTGAFGHVSSGITTSAEQLASGFWRPCVQFQAAAVGAGAGLIGLYCAAADGGEATPSYAGSTGNRICAWGVMIESGSAGARPSSYVRTTTSDVTREADGGLTLSGAAFAAIVPSAAIAMSLAAEFSIPLSGYGFGAHAAARVDDGTSNNRCLVGHTGSTGLLLATATTGGVQQLFVSGGAATQGGTALRVAAGIAANSGRAAWNGTLSSADSSVVVPAVDRLVIGAASVAVHVRRVCLTAGRVADAGLQAVSLDLGAFDGAVPVLVPWTDLVPVTHTPVAGYLPFGRPSADGKLPDDERDPRGACRLLLLDAPADVTDLTLQFEDPTNPLGFFQVAIVWAGMSDRPAIGFSNGVTIETVEETRRRRTPGGTLHARSMWQRQRMTIPFDLVRQPALAAALGMAKRAGTTRPVLFSVLPVVTNVTDQDRLTIFGTLVQPPAFAHAVARFWKHTYTIEAL